jgi:prepilin-type N-terminal cleavage/methylation domain-containing protein
MSRGEQKETCALRFAGFTMVELLVVMAIIGILASMLLSALSNAKERVQQARCLSNFHQFGIGIRLWVDDYGHFPYVRVPEIAAEAHGYPLAGGSSVQHTIGGPHPYWDPQQAHSVPSVLRPLNQYVPASDVYRCGSDAGQLIPMSRHYPPGMRLPSNWISMGSSYMYNAGDLTFPPGGGFKLPRAPEDKDGIALKPESWVPNPSKYIVMHEPPARHEGG